VSINNAIIADKLSKYYHVYGQPQDRLKQYILPRIQRIFNSKITEFYKKFCALEEISFTVCKGETLGIIGRNGSGKSTLLQIICGTLTQTSGDVFVNGRIAALLELGSGFNPEFTGKENIYLYGNLFGLTPELMNQRFDNIASFADIGDFIDQPLKTYSSGMILRLAFAVIVNVDADILIIDEALAVGDAAFTQKCMRFLRDFKSKNGTIIFVSHDMSSTVALCDRCLWLDRGTLKAIGDAKIITEGYLHSTLQNAYGEEVALNVLKNYNHSSHITKTNDSLNDNSSPKIDELSFKSSVENEATQYNVEFSFNENLSNARGWHTKLASIVGLSISKHNSASDNLIFKGGDIVRLEIVVEANEAFANPIIGFLFRDKLGQDLFGENTLGFTNKKRINLHPGDKCIAKFIFKLPNLLDGDYAIMTSFANGSYHSNIQHHFLHNAIIVKVFNGNLTYGIVGADFSEISMEIIQ
jgi:lipopolysaccharide transport system ATP-binding protein